VKVTVLMPVYRGGKHLAAALDGLRAQTYKDFEVLVVDDGSDDGSRDVVRSYQGLSIRLVENGERLGLTATLNRGLRLTESELIARHDADDLSEPRRLERQIAFLERHPEVVVLGTQCRVVDEQGRYVERLEKPCSLDGLRWEMLFENGFIHTSVMFRRAVVLDEFGGYDESYRFCQDFDLWSRMMGSKAVANLDEALVSWRVQAGSMTQISLEANARESARALSAHMKSVFGEALSEADTALILQYRSGVPRASSADFLRLVERLLEGYLRRYPRAADSVDFRRSVARLLARVLVRAGAWGPALLGRGLAARPRRYPLRSAAVRELVGWASKRLRFAVGLASDVSPDKRP
jgi:hypothetical protein